MIKQALPSLVFHSGNAIPQIGYGTYQLKGADCEKGVEIALKAGYNHIDTASIYGNEVEIASGLEPFYKSKQITRSQLFITSKISPAQQGYEESIKACETILKKLQTDYLDLLIIHWPGVSGLKPEDKKNAEIRLQTWKGLEKLKSEGKVKDIGVSNFLKHHLEHLLSNCTEKPVLNQIELHPLCYDKDLIDYHNKNNIVVEAYSPLARRDKALWENEIMLSIAKNHGKTVGQVALRWGVQHGFVVLPKSKTEKNILENLNIFDFDLTKEEMSNVDGLNKDFHTCWDPRSVKY